MPPFQLNALKHDSKDNRAAKILYCKKQYNSKVKIVDWSMIPESGPFDTDPYDPKRFRLHNSHFKRIGTYEDISNFISETQDAFKKNSTKRSSAFEENPNKKNLNFYSYKNYFCESSEDISCPRISADEYWTTMQYSYQLPYPYEMKRVMKIFQSTRPALKNENRMLRADHECKFLDDNFQKFTKTLQNVKRFRHISFDPYKGLYTDGSFIRRDI